MGRIRRRLSVCLQSIESVHFIHCWIMKILITGGAGYIGSVTAEYLFHQGHDVVVVDKLPVEKLNNLPCDPSKYNQIWIGKDTDKLCNLLRTFVPEGVIHFAGYIDVAESVLIPQKYIDGNVLVTLELIQAIVDVATAEKWQSLPKLVFSSTAAVYGSKRLLSDNSTKESNFRNDALKECDVLRPESPYGMTKMMAESLIQRYHAAFKLPFIILRYFNAAGASPLNGECHEPETHLIPNLIKTVSAAKKSNVNGSFKINGSDYPTKDGTCVRDYVHVLDLASAHEAALLSEKVSGVYNVGSGCGSSVIDIMRAVETIAMKKINIVFGDRRLGDPAVLVADISKIKEELGWRPKHSSINEIVSSAWHYHARMETIQECVHEVLHVQKSPDVELVGRNT